MRASVTTLGWCLGILIATAAPSQTGSLRVLTSSLERCVTSQVCTRKLESSGGLLPLRWRLTQGTSPPGLMLQADGTISGTPTSPGTFRFTIEVSDSAQPPQKDSRELTLVVVPALPMDWRQPPALRDTAIAGTLWVANNTTDDVVLTVVVVAVNEYGKAFTSTSRSRPTPPVPTFHFKCRCHAGDTRCAPTLWARSC